MTGVYNPLGADALRQWGSTSGTAGTAGVDGAAQLSAQLNDAMDSLLSRLPEQARNILGSLNNQDSLLPELEAPTVTVGGASLSLGGLSLEVLMDALGMEERKTAVASGVATMEMRAQQREIKHAERMEKVQEEIAQAKKDRALGPLKKAFQIIGQILGAVGSIAMIALGAIGLAAGGAGAGLIAVGVATLYMTVDSVVQSATDGKVGIGPGAAAKAIAKACGGSETAQMIAQMVVDILCSIALACTGVGLASSAVTAPAKATQVMKLVSGVITASSYAGIVNTVGQSTVGIASAVSEYKKAGFAAEIKEIEAILQRIAMANDLSMETIKALMQTTEQTMQQVSDIVKEGAATNTAILTASPSMA